jgi:hypothetical protein
MRAVALGAGLAAALAGPAAHAEAPDPPPRDPVELYFEGGGCDGEAIEIEVYDREAERWFSHPEHPRVPVPSCQVEDAGTLLNELRWRCAGSGGAGPWRHVAVFGEAVWQRCVELRALEEERVRIREAQRMRLELEAETGSDRDASSLPSTAPAGGEPRHGTASPRGDD